MSNIVSIERHISTMSDDAIEKVRRAELEVMTLPQMDIPTEHVLHGGMYMRTIFIPKGVILTGVVVKVPTMFIVAGEIVTYTENGTKHLKGYCTFTADAHRKQILHTLQDTYITITMASNAKTVDEAEREFTDEVELLASHHETSINRTLITGA